MSKRRRQKLDIAPMFYTEDPGYQRLVTHEFCDLRHSHVVEMIQNAKLDLAELKGEIKKGMWLLVTILGGLAMNMVLTIIDKLK